MMQIIAAQKMWEGMEEMTTQRTGELARYRRDIARRSGNRACQKR